MDAKAMLFITLIPDWNSLDSVRRVHSVLEATALVCFALLVLFDVLAHFAKRDEKKERILEEIALCFFGVAVLAEIVAYPYGQRNDFLSAQIINSLDVKARTAASNASTALTDSGIALSQSKDALTKAGKAEESLGKAETEAKNAEVASSNALTLAKGAREEADSFEADIKSAKKQAAEAESHLAEATNSANILTAKLERLTTPRRLPRSATIAAPLKTFEGMEYAFVGTCADEECFTLVSDIDELLKSAGWKRVKGPPLRIGIAQFKIHGDKDFGVDDSVSIGIGVAVETPNGMESLKGLRDDQLPEHIRAAVVLNRVLALNVSPSENTGKLVGVDTGTSTAVKIDVGRKPL
jgi:hypothetical protein